MLIVLLGLALMLAGPSLSRKGAAWALKRLLFWERRRALALPAGPQPNRLPLHQRVAKGPNNLLLAAAFQVTDFLHGAVWTVLLALVSIGWHKDGWFILVMYGFSYFFICLIRWPVRRVVQEVANYIRSTWQKKPTLPFFQETLMLWREVAPVAYEGLLALPERHQQQLMENAQNTHALVYEDAIDRLRALGYPHPTVDKLLEQLLLSAYTNNQLRAVRLCHELVPRVLQPRLLARILAAKTAVVRAQAWRLYDRLPPLLQQETAHLLQQGLNEPFLLAARRWLKEHPLDRTEPLHEAIEQAQRTSGPPGSAALQHGLVAVYELINDHAPAEAAGFGQLTDPLPLARYVATQLLRRNVARVHLSWQGEDAPPETTTDAGLLAKRWLDHLVPALHDTNKLVVTGAVEALQAATGDSALRFLKQALDAAPTALNRAWLLELLTPHAQAPDTPWAVLQLQYRDSAVQAATYRLLGHLGEAAVQHLVLLLEQEEDPTRLSELINAVSQLQHPAALGVLFQLQSHAEPAVRAAAEAAAQHVLAPEELYTHLPNVGLGGSLRFTPADFDVLLQRKDIRLVPRLIELYIAAPRGPFNRNPLKGRLALRTLINAAVQAQASLRSAYPALYCKRCLAPARRTEHQAWETNGQRWAYVQCVRCQHDRFLAPGVRRIVGYLGQLPEADRHPETLYLPLWDAPAQAAQYAYATLARVEVAPGLDGTADWAISAVLNALKNHHTESQLPPWSVDASLPLSDNTRRLLAPYLHATPTAPL